MNKQTMIKAASAVLCVILIAIIVLMSISVLERRGADETTASDPVVTTEESRNEPDATTDAVTTEPEQTTTEAMTTEPQKPKKLIAITLDDGPNKNYSADVLDVLKKYNVKATYFLIGQNIGDTGWSADLVKRISDEGHEIGSHMYSHTSLKKLTPDEIHNEEKLTAEAIFNACGKYPEIMRSPGGAYNDDVQKAVSYPMIRWTVDTLDWDHRNSQKVLESVMENAYDGGIILMHDRLSISAEATELVIKWLLENDYEIVTVSEMMERKGITLEAGNVYYSTKRVDEKPN